MSGQWSTALVAAAVGLCAMSAVFAAQAPRQTPNIVRQIDHILIISSEAKELFSLLSDTFQFPVVWPMSDYGSFASGGVAVGDVNLEVLKASESATSAVRSRFVGFAIEPEPLRTSLPELEARGIPHGAPAPFRSRQPNGSTTTLWTTVGLPDVSRDTVEVFFCEYEHDVPARRRRSLEQLRSRDGGPLSVHSIREIVYGVTDVKRMQEHWQKLLNPLKVSSQGVWPVGAGPAIGVIQADKDGIRGVVIDVKSLQQARRFLKDHGLLGTASRLERYSRGVPRLNRNPLDRQATMMQVSNPWLDSRLLRDALEGTRPTARRAVPESWLRIGRSVCRSG